MFHLGCLPYVRNSAGKELFLVDSEDKVIAFLKEYYFGKTSKKHVKSGADFKALVPVKFDSDGQHLPADPGALFNSKWRKLCMLKRWTGLKTLTNRPPLLLNICATLSFLVLDEAEVDKNGCNVILVPLGKGSL